MSHNARYYTLADVPGFDSDGLWRCRGVLFSRYGTLAQTVVALVKRSAEGLSAAHLSERLGMNGHSFLSGLAAHPELHRQKFGGRFVYFATEGALRAEQQRARRTVAPKALLPRAPAAVAILVERIRSLFGTPLAVVQDRGAGILKAVSQVFAGRPWRSPTASCCGPSTPNARDGPTDSPLTAPCWSSPNACANWPRPHGIRP